MIVWDDPFGAYITPDVRRCDKCGAEMNEGDSAYFTGADMLCCDCAEEYAKAEAERITADKVHAQCHAMEKNGFTRQDVTTLYDLIQDIVGDEEETTDEILSEMRVVLDKWGEGHVA